MLSKNVTDTVVADPVDKMLLTATSRVNSIGEQTYSICQTILELPNIRKRKNHTNWVVDKTRQYSKYQ